MRREAGGSPQNYQRVDEVNRYLTASTGGYPVSIVARRVDQARVAYVT